MSAEQDAKHQVDLGHHFGHNAAISRIFHRIHHALAKFLAVLQEENRQDRHQQKPPHALDGLNGAQHKVLRRRDDFALMSPEVLHHAIDRLLAPTAAGATTRRSDLRPRWITRARRART